MHNNMFPQKLSVGVLLSAIAILSASLAQADTISGNINTSSAFSPTNQSTDGVTYYSAPSNGNFSPVVIGEFDFSVPANDNVTGFSLSGNFGSNVWSSGTAPVDLYVNNIEVAVCDATCEAASNSADVAWTYAFSASQLSGLAAGKAVLTAVETGPSQIVLDPTSATVQISAVPEPDSILLWGAGLALVAALTRRKSTDSRA